ncbi:MAG TPA: glycosyl transferase [Clostridiales bacterium]|nr:glycosyl transferase [Clostridiales bacterium]
MIPKIIHYCWFGGNPFSELEQKCIDSWKKYMPDYKIVEWNESNFNIQSCDYVREAYEAKKWAFVSDYARYKILYENGGIYLDTDVELLKPLADIIDRGNYMGCENYTKEKMKVNPGLGCASVAGHSFYKEILEEYESDHFLNEDGTPNLNYTIVDRTTELLQKHGLTNTKEIQEVDTIFVYPAEYFSPKGDIDRRLRLTSNTYSIHHYKASWVPKNVKRRTKFLKILYRLTGKNGFNALRKLFGKRDGRI